MNEEERVCQGPGCDVTFMPTVHNQLYHSPECKQAQKNVLRRRQLTADVVAALAPSYGLIDEPSVEYLKKEVAHLARENERLKNVKSLQGALVRDALVEGLQEFKLDPIDPPIPDGRTHGTEVAVAVLADLQLSKVTPTYNTDVCEKRVDLYADKISHIIEIQRADHPVNRLHVWLLGDIIEGAGIFPGQSFTVDAGFYRQITIHGPRILGNFLRRMLQVVETIHVTAVIGNHGRIGTRGRDEFDPESNGDRMLYRILELMFREEPRITFNIPDGPGERNWYAIDTIGNYRSLLCHGDQFDSFGSMYAIGRKVLGWKAGAIEEPWDDIYIGHFHQATKMTFGKVTLRVSPSTESTNLYAQEKLASIGFPAQDLMFVHPEKGIVTSEYTIRLDER